MESGTGARWRALVLFIPLAAESESMPFGWRELLPTCIVVISDSGKGPFTNDVSREGEGGGCPNADVVREVA